MICVPFKGEILLTFYFTLIRTKIDMDDFLLQLEAFVRILKLSGHVGFDSLPDQLVNKSVQNGFVFNIELNE